MTLWTERTFYVLKCDTTGLDPVQSELLTVNIVKFSGGQYEDERSWVLKPKNGIDPSSIPYHGITPEWADKNGTLIEDVIEEITALLSKVLGSKVPLVVFNAQFDLGFIEAAGRKAGIVPLSERVSSWENLIDPMLIAQGHDRFRAEAPLRIPFTHKVVAEVYDIPYSKTVGALVHAETTAQIVAEQWAELDYLHKMTKKEVFEQQATWNQKIKGGLRDWMKRSGKDYQSVDLGWPISDKAKSV